MAYTQEIYVSTLGSDTSGAGTSLNPYATIPKAITAITTTDPIIRVSSGTYVITDLKSLTKASTNVTVRGKYINTIIQCSTGTTYTVPYVGKLDIIDCILTTTSAYGGDTRMLSYSTDSIEVNFRNVIFKKNGTYPSSAWFFSYSSASSVNRNKNFYNCTFTSALQSCTTGVVTISECATEATSYGNTLTAPTTSKVSCTLDNYYKVTNFDNSIYGVYSGTYRWLDVTYFIYCIATGLYYTISGGSVIQTTVASSSDIETNGFLMSAFNNTILNSQALKNISPFKIKAFSTNNISKASFQLNGQLSTRELVVDNNTISTLLASTLSRFVLTNTVVGTGSVKIAVSNDEKATWKTWNGTSWDTLTYKESDGILFKNEIYTNGMTPDVLSASNISLINTNNTFNFVYVLDKPLYSDDIIINKLTMVYNSKVHYNLINNTDIATSISEDYIKIIPARNITKLKVNVMT